jgi:hypothetical protein
MFYVILLLAFYPFYMASKMSSFQPENQLYVEMQVKKEDFGDNFWAARAQTRCMPCFTACF